MNDAFGKNADEVQLSARPDVRIEVKDFGPIKEGKVSLRPLTVFVGPSNTGKTYLAVLIYALHKIFRGFPRLPVIEYASDFMDDGNISASKEEVEKFIARLISDERPLHFSDLPEAMREAARKSLMDPSPLAEDLMVELRDSFDVKSAGSLIRTSSDSGGTDIRLSMRENDKVLWRLSMHVSESGIHSNGSINDMEVAPTHRRGLEKNYGARYRRELQYILSSTKGESENKARVARNYRLVDILLSSIMSEEKKSVYLPAARSGIMQSHRVIASSLMKRSTQAGLERFPEPLTFSSVIVDFMRRLIAYDPPRRSRKFRSHQRAAVEIQDIADALETGTLEGRIKTTKPSPGGYPEFIYRPSETKVDIHLNRASSMVSELAPVVLFIRGGIQPGDTFIIEEPEAHLHPAAQTEMAIVLARLVRAGVRVVVTTHSDWLLKEIGNLMREGELEERAGPEAGKSSSPGALSPRDVGIWLFREEAGGGSTVREIPFDRVDGIEPSDYENVAEQLYNRSADLQNRFEEENAGGGARS